MVSRHMRKTGILYLMEKAASCFLLILLLTIVFSAPAQEKLSQSVSYSSKNKSIVQTLEEISKEIDVAFSYSRDIFPQGLTTTVDFKNGAAKELIKLVVGAAYNFEMIGDYLVIYKSKLINQKKPLSVQDEQLSRSQNNIKAKKNPDTLSNIDTQKEEKASIVIPMKKERTIIDTVVHNIIIYDTVRLISYDTLTLIDTVVHRVNVPVKPKPGVNKKHWNLDVIGLSSFVSHRLVNPENIDAYNDYKRVSVSLPQMGFGLQLHLELGSAIVSTGLIYGSISENIEFRETSSGFKPKIDTVSTFFEEVDGKLVPVYITDTTLVAFDVTNNVAYINKRSFLEIPLMLGWQLTMKNLSFRALGGIAIVLPLDRMFNVPIKNNDSYDITNTQESIYHFNYRVSAEVSYKIGNKMSVLVAPFYVLSIDDYLTSDASFPLKREVMGLSFGLRSFF